MGIANNVTEDCELVELEQLTEVEVVTFAFVVLLILFHQSGRSLTGLFNINRLNDVHLRRHVSTTDVLW